MIAFAGNSVLSRLALVDPENSALSFSIVRLFFAALVLSPVLLKNLDLVSSSINIRSLLAPTMLFSYALFFSLSYVELDSGVGALILFALVQITMMAFSFLKGESLNRFEVAGFLLSIGGFVYLVFPGSDSEAVPLLPSVFMVLSGISWGLYSIAGKSTADPILGSSFNFAMTLPLLVIVFAISPFELTSMGWVYGIVSGALTSGLGYVLWYMVLKDLKVSTASIAQLSVPSIAAIGGVLFLEEVIDARLVVSSILIYSGIILKVRFGKS